MSSTSNQPTTSNDLTTHTTRGAPFFVANQKVLLAINFGTAPILKNAAEELHLFTLSCLSTGEQDVTLTMRLFEDMKSVVNGLTGRIEHPLAGMKSELGNYQVAVCMGFRTFQHDLLLHQLASTLSQRGHPIIYYFLDKLLVGAEVDKIINNKSEWDIKTQARPEAPTFPADFSSNTRYQFLLAPLNVVEYTARLPPMPTIQQVEEEKTDPYFTCHVPTRIKLGSRTALEYLKCAIDSKVWKRSPNLNTPMITLLFTRFRAVCGIRIKSKALTKHFLIVTKMSTNGLLMLDKNAKKFTIIIPKSFIGMPVDGSFDQLISHCIQVHVAVYSMTFGEDIEKCLVTAKQIETVLGLGCNHWTKDHFWVAASH